MTADHRKPGFEPPPWEREAFDRFQAERAKARASEELEDALRQVRSADQPQEARDDEALTPAETIAQAAKTGLQEGSVPQAKIDSMLTQLRIEEVPAPKASPTLINGTTVALALAGLVIIVQSALLFSKAYSPQGTEPSLNMLAATMSFVVFVVGLGFVAGAALLFRKYHH